MKAEPIGDHGFHESLGGRHLLLALHDLAVVCAVLSAHGVSNYQFYVYWYI
jgi:hypothetical protein